MPLLGKAAEKAIKSRWAHKVQRNAPQNKQTEERAKGLEGCGSALYVYSLQRRHSSRLKAQLRQPWRTGNSKKQANTRQTDFLETLIQKKFANIALKRLIN